MHSLVIPSHGLTRYETSGSTLGPNFDEDSKSSPSSYRTPSETEVELTSQVWEKLQDESNKMGGLGGFRLDSISPPA